MNSDAWRADISRGFSGGLFIYSTPQAAQCRLKSVRQCTGEASARDAVAERARALAEAALEEGVALGDGALLRAAAEMFALAACIGSDAHAVNLLRTLCAAMEASAAPSRWSLATISRQSSL